MNQFIEKGSGAVKRVQNWKVVGVIQKILDFLRPMDVTLHGAYASFFLSLSVFPMLVILFGALGYTSYGVEDLLDLLEGFVPESFLPMIENLLTGAYANTSGAVVSVSAVAALWSASRGIRGLMVGLNAVYGVEEDRSYLLTRTISVGYTFLFVIVLVLTLVLHVFGSTILDYLRMTTLPLLQFLMNVIDLRFVLLLCIQTAVFTAMYAALPCNHNKIRRSLPGAVLASLGWLIFSDLFSIYVEHFQNYANIFGSVYAVALAMLWLYICVCIIFYGAALNRWLVEGNND